MSGCLGHHPWKGLPEGRQRHGGLWGGDWPPASGREGLSLEVLHAAHFHPQLACEQLHAASSAPALPHGPERCCQPTLPLQGTKLYECRDVTSGHDPESGRALSSGLSHRADHASATTQTNTSLL